MLSRALNCIIRFLTSAIDNTSFIGLASLMSIEPYEFFIEQLLSSNGLDLDLPRANSKAVKTEFLKRRYKSLNMRTEHRLCCEYRIPLLRCPFSSGPKEGFRTKGLTNIQGERVLCLAKGLSFFRF